MLSRRRPPFIRDQLLLEDLTNFIGGAILTPRSKRWSWVNDPSDHLYVRYTREILIYKTLWACLIC